ncbi:SDR family NAD(P)-dependent oxidoreductase [Streptomyces sp. RKCA744]|uniref:SDR family NAD(P)-dependent oxidoreductase n=1 Tax=Streptomyces sp. RKCA744 TaxID=2959340 RepID=UPI0020A130C6|nr:SDR family NAD(P)-dependent oxidoreductase [Streptomyces sp. RKCA744]MCO8308814.1 SDR family NAD(P)-dependent oxidoreductase [Streptomyces sp. RKCA744]
MSTPLTAEPPTHGGGGGSVRGTRAATRPVRRLVWRPVPAPPPDGRRSLEGRTVLVLGGDPAVAARTREAVRTRGAVLVATPPAPPGSVWQRGPVPDIVVDLTLAERFTGTHAGSWRTALLRTFAVLRHVYEPWRAQTSARRLVYLAVTYLGGAMGYGEGEDIVQPLGGLWAGLAKTLGREVPNCACRVLDVGPADLGRLPDLVVEELSATGPNEVGYRDGRRWSLAPEARPPGLARVVLGPEDTLLVSGGGRGIGMALARSLARDFGVHVVVTGRAPSPPGGMREEPDPELLRARRAELWRRHRHGRPVAAIRRDIAAAEREWELARNLAEARAEGLRIEYVPCDVTDAGQVAALVDRLPGLTGVVHNAGVDLPARLSHKSDADVVAVVAAKVDSFVHLLRAVHDRPLKLWCSVGSLAGRLGGTVGQLDYAAANEALTRLGLWAGRRVGFPVMTLCWPTWDRLGLITNFRASLRYMAAMDVTEGLRHWRAELLAGTRGEAAFAGPLGSFLDPVPAAAYPALTALPGSAGLRGRIFHLGEALAYRRGERWDSYVEFDLATASAMRDFTVHGGSALPLSLLLESAVGGAEWLVPAHFPQLALVALEGVRVPLAVLRCDAAGRVRLRREMRGFHRDERWVVDVVFRPVAGPREEARLRLVRGDVPGDLGAYAARPLLRDAGTATTLWTDSPVLEWGGRVIPVSAWAEEGAHRVMTEVRSCRGEELWADRDPPPGVVPVSALENVLRVTTGYARGLSRTPDPLTVPRVVVRGRGADRYRVVGDPAMGVWRIGDAGSGAPIAVVSGLPGIRG